MAEGDEATIAKAFYDAYMVLNRRITIFLSLPIEKLDQISLRRELAGIGSLKA
jgi:arsenate reductase